MFNNFWATVRFILRRERIVTPIWVISIAGFTVGLAPLLHSIYGSPQDLATYATMMNNPAMVAMVGPAFGIDNYTMGAFFANMMLLFMAITCGVMSIFFVNRHTRMDEEQGNFEILRSLPVGRLTQLTATMFVITVINLILSFLIGFGLFATGLQDFTLQGSLVFGFSMGMIGLIYAAITGLFAQIASTSRATLGYSFIFLMADYLLRAVGDMNNETLARISPQGLMLRTQALVNNYWWPLLILLLEAIVLIFLAFYLLATRDLGAGLIHQRSGKTHAPFYMRGYFTLAKKLVLNTFFIWLLVAFVLAAAYGSVLGDISTFIAGNAMLSHAFSGQKNVVEAFIPFIMVIMSIIATIPVITITLRGVSEEKHGFLDQILGNAVSRTKVLGSYGLHAFVASFFLLFANGFGFWLSGSQVMENPIALSTFLQASLVYLPALWVFIGLSILLSGWFPKATLVVWIYLVYTFFVTYIGQMLDLADIFKQLTPFGSVPNLPVDEMNWLYFIVMSIIALILTVIGLVGYRRRDISH